MSMRRYLPMLAAAATVAAVDLTGGLAGLDNRLVEWRMVAAPRAATGSVVVVDIDARSLAEVGVWPWPRSIHATIIDRLVDLGAAEIAFDVDFSTASSEAEDAALEAALARAGGAVTLAAFQQSGTAKGGSTVVNRPLPRFAQHAWTAGVNVQADGDGRVRRISYGEVIAGEPTPSLAALIGSASGSLGQSFAVDFSIAAAGIPHVSAIDLIRGTVAPGRIAGKKVVIGASAAELHDFFYVPVHGLVSGAVLQVLGAETLMQGRALGRTTGGIALAVMVLLGAAGVFFRLRWTAMLALLIAGGGGAEILAGLIQAAFAVAPATAPLQAGLALLAVSTLLSEIDVGAILLRISRNQTRNTQTILDRVVADNFAGIIVIDHRGRVLAASIRAVEFLRGGEAITGHKAADVLPAVLNQAVTDAFARVRSGILTPTGHGEAEVERGGEQRFVEYVVTPSRLAGDTSADADRYVVCLTFSDITERRAAQIRDAYLARYDTLTGIANRNQFVERLDQAGGDERAVLSIALERLGQVNETFGDTAGDSLLKAFGERIAGMLGEGEMAARLGGDVFAVLTTGAGATRRAEVLGRALLLRVGESYQLDGHRLVAGLSIGVAGDTGAMSSEALVRAGETAVQRARAAGGNTLVVFEEAMIAGQASRRKMEIELWEAFEHGQFEVAYQPQVDLSDGSLVGVEALLRWNHPGRGAVSPAEFVPIIEAIGLIEPIGEWVLERACRDAAAWPGDIKVAVNASAIQFARGNLPAAAERALARSGLAAGRLGIEITESVFLEDPAFITETLKALRALGASIALDDFGTGYSSLAYLRRFPIDKVKLDRSFIVGLPYDQEAAAIVRAVGALGKSLGIRLNAEGVERPEQVALLRLTGFEEGQGYLFGRAVPAADIAAGLRDGTAQASAIVA
jgi:diguanylate cyclase (GGDEF)-like protein